MKNNKIALLPGLSLFLCFCLLTGMGRLAGRLGGGAPLTALSEAAAFLLPMVLAVVSLRDQKAVRQRLRPRRLPKGALGVTAVSYTHLICPAQQDGLRAIRQGAASRSYSAASCGISCSERRCGTLPRVFFTISWRAMRKNGS